MKRSAALLTLAAVALSSTLAVQATGAQEAGVRDAVVLEERLPRTLAAFGFFRDEGARVPADRVTHYELNTPLWSDGADKLRYIYVPQGSEITPDPTAENGGLLQFPVGSAIIKTFAFGEGEDQRFIETRVLLHRADGWLALPYRWNEEQTEARLALAGARIALTTPEGEEISYRIPNKNQCKSCHSKDGEVIPIGPKVRNLAAVWMESIVERGLIDAAPEETNSMPHWAHETSGSVELRARAYLDVNCAHCHQPGAGASNSGLDLRWEQDDPFAIGVRKPPVAAGRGAGGFLVSIAPGEPDKSILVHRMNSNDPGVAMPELGRSTIDTKAVALMREWIAAMPADHEGTSE